MIRICWLSCLLSLAVSTQTVRAQSPDSPPCTIPVDPAILLQQQVDEFLRSLQRQGGSPGTPSGECTRFQGNCPQSARTIEVLMEDGLPQERMVEGLEADCCKQPGSCPQDAEWMRLAAAWMNGWFHAWQRGTCQMSQAARVISAAAAGPVAQESTGARMWRRQAIPATPLTGAWLMNPPQYFPPSPPFPLPREITMTHEACRSVQLSADDIRWLKDQGVSDQVILQLTKRIASARSTKTCPYAQALAACSGSTCCMASAVPWLVKAMKPCCASFLNGKECGKSGCCCQNGTTSDKPATGGCCPFSLFGIEYPNAQGCPFSNQNANPGPVCPHAAADKAGCCGNAGCKCCKGSSVNQEIDRVWGAYLDVLTRLFGNADVVVNPMPPSSPFPTCVPNGPHVAVPQMPGAMVNPMQHWPAHPPCIIGELSPHSPYGPCPAMPFHNPGQFPTFAPPPPYMGYGLPVGGGAPYFMHPQCGGPVPGGCPMPGTAHAWAPPFQQPQAYLQMYPVADPKLPVQPVALPGTVEASKEECKIVAKDGVVQLTTANIEASCTSISYSGRDRVVLEGNVRLVYKKGNETTRIEAPRVVVDLNQGTFTVESGNAPVPASTGALQVLPPPVGFFH